MKLFKVSLNIIFNISDLYKMKQYITYILIGLAIAIVIGLGLYLKKKFDSLEERVSAMNAELFTVRNYMSSEKRLGNEDMFSANTQQNIALEINNKMSAQTVTPQYNENTVNENMNEQINVNDFQETSPNNSYDRLNDEVTNLRADINNIEDLLEDSSGGSLSRESDDLDAEIYEQQLQNIETTGNHPLDDSLIEQVQQVNEVVQIASRNDDYIKNNNSEFEDLANVDLEHNSEFDELLEDVSNDDNTEQALLGEESNNESTGEHEGKSDSDSVEEETVDSDDNLDGVEIDSNLKMELDMDVITNSFTKTELINLCIENNVSKSGNKTVLVERLIEAGVDLTSDNSELQTINSS